MALNYSRTMVTEDASDRQKEDELQRKIDDAKVEGWKVNERQGDRAVMVKNDLGSFATHLVIFVLLGWWTLGGANLCYAGYRWFAKSDRRVVRVE